MPTVALSHMSQLFPTPLACFHSSISSPDGKQGRQSDQDGISPLPQAGRLGKPFDNRPEIGLTGRESLLGNPSKLIRSRFPEPRQYVRQEVGKQERSCGRGSFLYRSRSASGYFSLAATGLMCQSTFLCEEQYHAHLARRTMSQLR